MRDLVQQGIPLDPNLLAEVVGHAQSIAMLNTGIGVLNLGVSIAGFAMVLNRLNKIGDQLSRALGDLREVKEELRWIDSVQIAQIKGEIDSAFDMALRANRQNDIRLFKDAKTKAFEVRRKLHHTMRAMLDSKRALRRHDVFASFARASAIIAVAEARCDEAVESVTQTIRALRVALRDLRALVTSFDDLRRNFASDPRTMIELGSTGRVHLTAVSGEFSTILQQVEGVADQLTLRDALGLSVDAWSALTAPEGSGLLTCLILPEGSEEQAMWRSAWC